MGKLNYLGRAQGTGLVDGAAASKLGEDANVQFLQQGSKRIVLLSQPGCAEFHGRSAARARGKDAAADAVAGFEHQERPARLVQFVGECKARQAGADDDNFVLGLVHGSTNTVAAVSVGG